MVAKFVVSGIMDMQFAQEVADMLVLQLPGLIVRVDERVVYSDIPDPVWRGGAIEIIGLDQQSNHMEYWFETLRSEARQRTWDDQPITWGWVPLTLDEERDLAMLRTRRRIA